MTDTITSIGFNDLQYSYDMDYADDYVAFHYNFVKMPIDRGTMKVGMYIVTACMKGKVNVEINNVPYSLSPCDLIICHPNATVNNCMMSPDFEGAALCLSKKAIQESFNENDLLDKALFLMDNPMVHISEESVAILNTVCEAIDAKSKSENPIYKKHIIISLVKAVLLEVMTNISIPDTNGQQARHTLVREDLFKSFITLLSNTTVKPRTVAWYADRLNVTPKYLSTVCRQASSKTAFTWISEFVEKDIVFWLRNSSKSIKEIADMLQFPSISFFGKYCRQHFGMSPKNLREQLRDNR